jgi:hypothetical protein
VRGRTEPEDPHALGVAGHPKAPPADEPSAQERRRALGVEAAVDGEAVPRIDHDGLRVAAVDVVAREARVRAQVLAIGATEAACLIGPREPRQAHAIADGALGHALADRVDVAEHLMAEDHGMPVERHIAVRDMEVGSADAARTDPEAELAGAGLGEVELDGTQRSPLCIEEDGTHIVQASPAGGARAPALASGGSCAAIRRPGMALVDPRVRSHRERSH